MHSVNYLNVFSQGQTWVKNVRKCLMKAIRPYFKAMYDCAAIKSIALQSYEPCYEKCVFCDVFKVSQNWEALLDVYKSLDGSVPGADRTTALRQVTDSVVHYAWICLCCKHVCLPACLPAYLPACLPA